MTDTNLITQAVTSGLEDELTSSRSSLSTLEQNFTLIVNGLQADYLSFQANLISVLNQNNTSLNNALVTALNNLNSTVNNDLYGANGLSAVLANHIAMDYSKAHSGITSSVQTYLDTAGATVGNYVVNLTIGGTTYYVPASLNSAGVYVPPPPVPPPPPPSPPSPAPSQRFICF